MQYCLKSQTAPQSVPCASSLQRVHGFSGSARHAPPPPLKVLGGWEDSNYLMMDRAEYHIWGEKPNPIMSIDNL